MFDNSEQRGNILKLKKSLISLDICDENKRVNEKPIVKKGKIHKGPIYNAYNRENLGSIPGNLENILSNEKKSQIGFLSQSDRFTNSYMRESKLNIPGPGSYIFSALNTTSDSFHSSKGFGNGFVSSCDRFNEREMYMNKHRPGPGEYKSTEKYTIANSVKNSMHYKSLYDKKEIKSLKIKRNLPGPGYYNPILNQAKDIENRTLSSFRSDVTRFKKNVYESKTPVPGPGNYFTENSNENKLKNSTTSSFFKLPMKKKENLLGKYLNEVKNTQDNTEHNKYNYLEDFKFNTETSNKNGKTMYNMRSGFFDEKKENQSMKNLNQKGIFSVSNQKIPIFSQDNNINFQGLKIDFKNNIQDLADNSGEVIEDQKEDFDYNSLNSKKSYKSIFKLSPPRWTQQRSNHVPGPAYYDPIPPSIKKNFNSTLSAWI